uniref:Reverse transcriptase domain-containing protein n=1 Tax=Caenorhabditis japonica TaxID=281687 RepID=A0A8R1IQ37_CAEJA
MANGYLQLKLDDESSYKCGLVTEDKVYAYTHLPFGLKSAASYFQRALRTVLAGMETDVMVYIDDVLIFSKTFESHVATLRKQNANS